MSKLALSVTLACLLAVVAVARGDEPAAPPTELKPTQAEPADAPPVIVIETTPELERSEVIGKLIEGLEKDGIAKRAVEDSEGTPVDFQAAIVVQADMPGEKIRKLIETLKAVSIERASIQLGPADGVSEVIVTCPADVTFQRVRTLHESLVKQVDFKIDVRVAGNDGPVTSTGPTMFTRSPQPLASSVDGGVFGGGGFGGAGSVAMGLPASAIPGRKWVAGTKVIVAFSEDGKQVFAYSEQQPRWVSQELEPVSGAVAVPVVGAEAVAVRYGNYCYAYSTTLGTWDVLNLPPGEVAIPAVSDEGIGVHSASQGDFVFKNSWGKWFSAEEIKAGRVAELLAQRNAAAASQPDEKTSQEFVVFYLKNVQATEAARIVRQVFGGKVNPAVEERTNSLIVASDDPLTVNRVRELLQAIELPAAKELALPQVAQSVDGLRRLYNELEQRTRELADGLRAAGRPPAAEFELRDTVKQAFEARQKLQRAELAEFAERLRRIQQSIELRDRVSQQIIDRRVEELLDPSLKWDAPAIISESQVPPVRDDDHVTNNNLTKSTPPADQSSSRDPGGKPLKAFVRPLSNSPALTGGTAVTGRGKLDFQQSSSLASSSPSKPTAGPASFIGQVLDQDEQPIEGAVIRIERMRGLRMAWVAKANTDEQGNFRVPDLSPGEIELFVDEGGEMAINAKLSLKPGENSVRVLIWTKAAQQELFDKNALDPQAVLDKERGELLSLQAAIRQELVELDVSKRDVAHDGTDVRSEEEKMRDNKRIAVLESRLDEVYESLRRLDKLQAILRERPAAANVSNAQANKADGSGDPRETQVVAQIPDAAYTRPTADDQRATATIPAEAWGEPVDGLRVAIVLRSPSIDKHQRLCYDIVAENVSDQDIRFGVTLGVDDGHNYCKTKMADADGNPLVQQAGSRLWLRSTLKRLWLKPKERGVISSWATGLLKQDDNEQLPVSPKDYRGPWYFSVEPGRYFVSAEVELGPNMNSTDPATGKRTVLSPAQGEWSGKLQTGAAAVELFTIRTPSCVSIIDYHWP